MSVSENLLQDPLVLFKAAVLNIASDEHVKQIIIDHLEHLVGAQCRLNRKNTMDIPTVQGKLVRFHTKKNKKNFRFKVDVLDDTTGLVLVNSKLVIKWIYQYGQHTNKTLRLIGSGWQEISVRLHAPYHAGADVDGYAWFALSCILTKELRQFSRSVLFEWMTHLFPLQEHHINTSQKATQFLMRYMTILQTIATETLYGGAVAVVQNKDHRTVEQQHQVQKTLLHLRQSINRNQSVALIPKGRKRKHHSLSQIGPHSPDRCTQPVNLTPRASTPVMSINMSARTLGYQPPTSTSLIQAHHETIPIPASLMSVFDAVF